jgi:undecaprenyl pyrophosphate phosphatase UppP
MDCGDLRGICSHDNALEIPDVSGLNWYNPEMAIDSYPVGALLVLLTAALAVGGLFLLRKCVSYVAVRNSHEVAGYLLSIVGTMYAVLVGLVVVDSMAKFQEARNNVQSEANAVADVFLLSEKFSPEKEKQIKQLCIHYVQRVIDFEWKEMDDGNIDMECRRTAISLLRAVEDFEPKTQSQQAIYPIAVTQVCQLWDCRRARTNSAQSGVPGEEWLVLLVGGVVTIIFVCFFNLKHAALQTAMTAMVAVLISLNLLLVLWFGYPFSGDRKVHPDAFRVDERIFENQLGHHPEVDTTQS